MANNSAPRYISKTKFLHKNVRSALIYCFSAPGHRKIKLCVCVD